jgi:hypothetical protein
MLGQERKGGRRRQRRIAGRERDDCGKRGHEHVWRNRRYMLIRNPDSALPETAGRVCPTSTGVEWDIGQPIVTEYCETQ